MKKKLGRKNYIKFSRFCLGGKNPLAKIDNNNFVLIEKGIRILFELKYRQKLLNQNKAYQERFLKQQKYLVIDTWILVIITLLVSSGGI